MKKLVFRIGAFVIFGIIIAAAVITSIRDNGWGSYSRTSAEITEGEPIVKFGQVSYNTLTRPQQYIYDAIDAAIKDDFADLTEEMPFVASEGDVSLAVDAIMDDHPEYFYLDADEFSLDGYYFVEFESDAEETSITEHRGESIKGNKYTTLQVHYTAPREELLKMRSRLEAAISKALSLASNEDSDIGRLTAIHDYITEICERADTSEDKTVNVSNAYGALVDGCADRMGYHKALKLLLNKAGMVCHIVEGKVHGSPSVWCVTLTGDKYYNTDVYEDDLDATVNGEEMRGVYTHAYLNVSDEAISTTHTDKSATAPKCTDNETYYSLNGLVAYGQGAVREIFDKQMKSLVRYKREYVEIFCEYDADVEFIAQTAKESFLDANSEYTPSGVACTVTAPKDHFNAYTVKISYELTTPETQTDVGQSTQQS